MEIWVFVLTVWVLFLSIFCLIQRGRIALLWEAVKNLVQRDETDPADEWKNFQNENDFKW